MRIKKGDTVQVLSGNDKGKKGEVLEVIPKTEKIVVKGVNVRKKHVKARKQGEESGILSIECAIHSSKVNVVCPKCNKPTRIGYELDKVWFYGICIILSVGASIMLNRICKTIYNLPSVGNRKLAVNKT